MTDDSTPAAPATASTDDTTIVVPATERTRKPKAESLLARECLKRGVVLKLVPLDDGPTPIPGLMRAELTRMDDRTTITACYPIFRSELQAAKPETLAEDLWALTRVALEPSNGSV